MKTEQQILEDYINEIAAEQHLPPYFLISDQWLIDGAKNSHAFARYKLLVRWQEFKQSVIENSFLKIFFQESK